MLVRVITCMLFLCYLSVTTHAETARLDLRDQPWSPGSIHTLDTEWDFYWQHFLDPELPVNSSLKPDNQPIPFPVPAAWNNPPDGFPEFPGTGFASYHLTVFIPPGMENIFLSIPDMASAYRLYNHGRLIAENGRIATQKHLEVPAYQPKLVSLTPLQYDDRAELDLVLQTSNFHYQWGGPWYPLRLTDRNGIVELREKPIIQAMLSATILIAASLFGLFMFASRPTQKVLLYFSLLCLSMGLRRLLIDERILYFYLGEHWHALQALENICTYLAFPLFISYFSHRFPVKQSKIVSRLSWLAITPFCLLALTTDVAFYTRFNVPFQILILISLPYIFYTFFKVLKEKRYGAKLFGFGLAIFIITVVNDILAYSYVITAPNLAHLGILAFVIFQGIDLAKSYLHNFETIEDLSITLQSQNRELIRIDSFKDEFLATTSHELRTPLHGIAGLARHLLQDPSLILNNSQKHKLDLIASSTQRLSALVNDILDFESIKHGQLKLYKKPVDLDTLCQSVINTLKPLLEGRDIHLSAQISEQARWVFADENRIQQILYNLLGNAIKFTEEGYIQVDATLESSHSQQTDQHGVMLEIRDTGMGISPDKLDMLFEPFQSKQDNPEYTSGSGLGLSISRQLVRQHGSELLIDSQPGSGTRIWFTLPLLPVSQRPASTAKSEFEDTFLATRSATRPHPEHVNVISTEESGSSRDSELNSPLAIEQALIFVVDDDEVNRELVKAQLQNAGYQVECFGGGHPLLERLTSTQPDLILLDLMMPMISGLEVCQRIRQHHDSYELPVMMLTARYQVSDIVDSLSAGANDYLIKPYHEKELLARVYSQLSARHFWISHQENQILKQEIDQRKKLQAELALANERMVLALNIADEGILLLNAQMDILYANAAARELDQSPEKSSVSTQEHLEDFLEAQTLQTLQKQLAQQTNPTQAIQFQTFDRHLEKSLRFTLHPFEENQIPYFALVISQVENDKTDTLDHSSSLLKELTNELARNRDKIEQIEQALKQVATLPAIAPGTAQPEQDNKHVSHESHRRELLVRLLREALLLWETHSHQSKADLAEASRCWRVYLDGTTAKTRTLDRYLSERTLPEKPRWQLVVRTAKYVIDHCALSTDETEKLVQMIDALNEAFG